MLYLLIFVVLLMAELIYFRIADKCNIIDKPNQRSSHSKVVLRGGGVIFLVGTWVWSCLYGFQYPWMLAAVTLEYRLWMIFTVCRTVCALWHNLWRWD